MTCETAVHRFGLGENGLAFAAPPLSMQQIGSPKLLPQLMANLLGHQQTIIAIVENPLVVQGLGGSLC